MITDMQEIPDLLRDLPLLRKTANYHGGIDLSKTLIICVQHLYSTTYTMFSELYKKGLDPQNFFVSGKCYSIEPSVYRQLKKDGVHVFSDSNFFDSHQEYDQVFQSNLEAFFDEFMEHIKTNIYEKIIILDDGGILLSIANKKISGLSNIIGIEQTSAGYNRLRKSKLSFPVVNVSRSWIKMKYESPIIINLALNKLKQKIGHISPPPKKVLVMGYGTLGQHVCKALQGIYDVSHFDLCTERSMFTPNSLRNELGAFDLIIGATGEASISRNLFPYLKRPVILSSVSSSDREFDAAYLRRNLEKTHNCHTDLHINGITLLNCGFPINFDVNYTAIDTDEFQLTRSIILGAIFQACKTITGIPEFIELDNNFQLYLERELEEIRRNKMIEAVLLTE
jgi:S-adenosylhomocysteine hydrolase